nr:uncharacterized protein LOC129277140 isoform X1 [Lytechinus pictus]
MRAQLENQQKELEILTMQKDSIKSRLDQKHGDVVQYDELKTRIQELESQISDQQEKGENVKDKLDASKRRVASLQWEKEAIEGEKNRLDQENKQIRRKWISAGKVHVIITILY